MRTYDRGMQHDDSIAIVVLTHNRLHLVQKCVENVLQRTSDATREIVIWDNASTDGTGEYLETLEDPRFRVIRSEKNIGQNGYARAFRETTAPYLIELDDDVTDAPAEWDATMLDAYLKLPNIGFLAADLEDDPNDEASQWPHHRRAHGVLDRRGGMIGREVGRSRDRLVGHQIGAALEPARRGGSDDQEQPRAAGTSASSHR